MLRRLVPLVMVLTIALCPVALDVCQVACAEHTHGTVVTSPSAGHHHHAEVADAMAPHHHGHDAAREAGTAPRIPAYTTGTAPRIPVDSLGTASRLSAYTLRGAPEGCLHAEELPAFVGTNLQTALTPVAAVRTLFELPGLTAGTPLFVDSGSVVHSPPLTLTTQLRV